MVSIGKVIIKSMAKREREEARLVLVSRVKPRVDLSSVISVFTIYGKIEHAWQQGKGSFFILFEDSQAADAALQLHNTRHRFLRQSFISVTPSRTSFEKKRNIVHYPYAVIDSPRFNNYLIPVLPSFLFRNFTRAK